MFRFFVVLLAAVCIAGGVAYSNGWLNETLGVKDNNPRPDNVDDQLKVHVELGELLYQAAPMPKMPQALPKNYTQLPIEPSHVTVRDKQDISYPKEGGRLLFIGQEKVESLPLIEDPSRPLQKERVFEGNEYLNIFYYPWEEGHLVEQGMMVAKLVPALAIHETKSRHAKVVSSRAEYKATVAILNEAQAKFTRLMDLKRRGTGLVTDEDLGAADATVKKYQGDVIQKQEAINVAEFERLQAEIQLSEHDLRSEVPGKSILKKKYHQNGESLKAQEPILQLIGITRLKVEGSVDSQYLAALKNNPNAVCYLEPSEELSHMELMPVHVGEVTCVAVCADGEHFVSGSEDTKVCVWQRGAFAPRLTLSHDSPVRSVACSPKGGWILVGCADGSISLWDLTQQPPTVKVIKDQHVGPVTALAFSPDGAYFASGGEDNSIILWKAAGEVLYPFDAADQHQGTITSLQFTPQCKLVSAARDNTLRVWDLHQKGAKLAYAAIGNRGGTVSKLGVSSDGRFMIFDKDKRLHLKSTADGSTVSVLENVAGANPFDTLALFSPDGSLMLTGGAGEGRLHLWKTPTPDERAYQVRELVTKDHTSVTTAAFAPGDRRFAVSGSKDGHVHLWNLPDDETVRNHRIMVDAKGQQLHLDLLGSEVEGGRTRIAVNVLNPLVGPDRYRLTPGQRVSVVVELPSHK